MKRIISLIMAAVMILPIMKFSDVQAVSFPVPTQLKSRSAMLMNLDTGMIVHEKNPDEKLAPGPLVNIMTAIIVLENCDSLSKELTLDPDIYTPIYTSSADSSDIPLGIDLNDNDVLTVRDLLYCMMLTSSVEASQTLAHYVGNGNVSSFVEKMNAKADELGMTNTHFTNAHGMFEANQYTTSRDMLTLTRYALKVPLFSDIATAVSYNPEVPNITRHPNHSSWIWNHSNVMADPENDDCYYMGAKGIKTARLNSVGRNLIVQASRDGNNYLAVLMIAPIKDADGEERYFHIDDARELFNWAFSSFSYQVILGESTECGSRDVTLGDEQDFVLARPKNEILMLWCDDVQTNTISKKIKWYGESFAAPISEGDVLGELTLEYSGEVLGKVELVANRDVSRSKSKYNIAVAKKFFSSNWFSASIKIAVLFSVIYILVCIYAMVLFKSKGKPVKPIYAVPKMNKKKKSADKPKDSTDNK